MTTPTATAHQLTLFETTAEFLPNVPTLSLPRRAPRRMSAQAAQAKALREALVPYVDFNQLRRLAASGGDIRHALRGTPPAILQRLFTLYHDMLTEPEERVQIKSPTDATHLLMLEMSHLDQEEVRVICLDTRNFIQTITPVYKGAVNSAMIRCGEIFKEAVRRNSPSIIMAHNHPSGSPDPSPEDVQVTRQIVEAGKLLDVELLDHLIIGHGRYVSMRERGLGFTK